MSEEQKREGHTPDIDAIGFDEVVADLKSADEAIPVARPVDNEKPVAKKLAPKPTKQVGKSISAVSVKDVQEASAPRKHKLPYVLVAVLVLVGISVFVYSKYFRKTSVQPTANVSSEQSDKKSIGDVDALYSTVKKAYDEIKSARVEDAVKKANETLALIEEMKSKYNAVFDKSAEDEQGKIRSNFKTLAGMEGFLKGVIIKANFKNKRAEEPKQAEQAVQALPSQTEDKRVVEEPKSQEPQKVEEQKSQEQPAEEAPPQVEAKKEEPPPQSAPQKEMSEDDIIKEADDIINQVIAGVRKFKPDYTNAPKESEAIAVLLNGTMDLARNLQKARDMLSQVRQKHGEPSYSYIDEKLKSIEIVRKYLLKQSEKLMQLK